MNKEEFLKQLEQLLSDINSAEREELEGKELIPFKEREEEKQEQKERGKENFFEFEEKKKEDNSDKKRMSTGAIVVIVLAAILFSPALIGVAMGILSALLGIFGAIAGVFVASAACVVGFGVGAAACLIVAIAKLFTTPVASLILLGAAMICLGLCALSVLLMLKMITVVFPGIVRGINYLVSLPTHKKEAAA